MLRFIQEVNTTTRSCALWDLEEETDYIVHVQSISMLGTSPQSEPLRFRTPKEAETQASKSKGKVAQNTGGDQHVTSSDNSRPHCAEGTGSSDNTLKDFVLRPIKINRHTKREIEFL